MIKWLKENLWQNKVIWNWYYLAVTLITIGLFPIIRWWSFLVCLVLMGIFCIHTFQEQGTFDMLENTMYAYKAQKRKGKQ